MIIPTLVFTFVIVLLVVLGMAIGVLMGREPLKGSCGGLSKLSDAGISGPCEICGGDPHKCDEYNEQQAGATEDDGLFHKADNKRLDA
jgi:hypothetical protein